MAHGAATHHRVAGSDKMGRCHEAFGIGRGTVLAGQHARRGRQPGDDQEQDNGRTPGPVRLAFPGMHRVEIVPDQHADDEYQRGDHPVELGREGQRVVVRQHQEDDGQRQVIVVQRARLGDAAIFGIGRAAGLEVGDHDLLVGDDDQEDIGRHDRGGERAQMQEGGAAGEKLREPPGHEDQHREEHDHQKVVVLAERRLAQLVVDQPADAERGKRDQDADRRRHVEHVAVDQIEVGAGIVDDGEQREAGQPGGVGFPFEPRQVLRHAGRRDQIFLDMVEAAAMDLPFLAMHALGHARPLHQPQVECDEIEG